MCSRLLGVEPPLSPWAGLPPPGHWPARRSPSYSLVEEGDRLGLSLLVFISAANPPSIQLGWSESSGLPLGVLGQA